METLLAVLGAILVLFGLFGLFAAASQVIVGAHLVAGAILRVASAPPGGGPAQREWGRSLVRTAEGRIALGTLGAVVLALAANLADPAYSEPIAFQVREHVTRPMHASLVSALGRGIVASLAGPKIPAMLAYVAPVAWGLALAEIGRAVLAVRRGAGPDVPRPGAPVDVLALRAAPDPLALYMMAWLASIVARAVPERVTPRWTRMPRSFSTARLTRFWAASSETPKMAPTDFRSRRSK